MLNYLLKSDYSRLLYKLIFLSFLPLSLLVAVEIFSSTYFTPLFF